MNTRNSHKVEVAGASHCLRLPAERSCRCYRRGCSARSLEKMSHGFESGGRKQLNKRWEPVAQIHIHLSIRGEIPCQRLRTSACCFDSAELDSSCSRDYSSSGPSSGIRRSLPRYRLPLRSTRSSNTPAITAIPTKLNWRGLTELCLPTGSSRETYVGPGRTWTSQRSERFRKSSRSWRYSTPSIRFDSAQCLCPRIERRTRTPLSLRNSWRFYGTI